MTKLVNLILHGKPVTCLKHTITNNMDRIYLTTEDIKKILESSNATVREVFPDGSTYDLNLDNYERSDLFEISKQEKQSQDEARKEQATLEAKIQMDIKAGKEARNKAIASILNSRKSSINQMAEKQVINAMDKQVNNAVEAARQQIEANKNL